MTAEKNLEHFKQSDALLDGHFILSSGLHSPNYLQCALALQYPADAARFGRAIAENYANERIETVASPAIGGLIIGYEVAKALNVRFVWTERENGAMTLRRGFALKENERILVVEDVITTGGSTRECIAASGNVAAEKSSARLRLLTVPAARQTLAFRASRWLVWTFRLTSRKIVRFAKAAMKLSNREAENE